LDGVYDTGKFDQEPVAHGLDKAAAVSVDGGPHDFVELVVEARSCTGFVVAHKAAVANHVCRDDRC
jgi:hypothetical protein